MPEQTIQETAAPPAVALVRDFVNTYEPQLDVESLHTAAQLRDWFAARGVVSRTSPVKSFDVAVAVSLREGLRAVLLGHAGHATDDGSLRALNHALAAIPVRLRFGNDGYHLTSSLSTPFGHALASIVDAIRQSSEDDTWVRLKVCARETCRWAYYDASRSQVRRWCSMSGCGNHIKMQRAYAARKKRALARPSTGATS